jgi:hypothetical protein
MPKEPDDTLDDDTPDDPEADARELIITLFAMVEGALGEPLEPEEAAHVLLLLAGWATLLAYGIPPVEVAAIARQELSGHPAMTH